jgi:hypothetical protein
MQRQWWPPFPGVLGPLRCMPSVQDRCLMLFPGCAGEAGTAGQTQLEQNLCSGQEASTATTLPFNVTVTFSTALWFSPSFSTRLPYTRWPAVSPPPAGHPRPPLCRPRALTSTASLLLCECGASFHAKMAGSVESPSPTARDLWHRAGEPGFKAPTQQASWAVRPHLYTGSQSKRSARPGLGTGHRAG